MDCISLLGPLPTKQQINQDEFDVRYKFVSREQLPQCKCEGTLKWIGKKIGDRKCEKNVWSSYFPSYHWISKYGLKSDLPRDLLGSFLLAALLLSHGLCNGQLALNEPLKGLYALFLPQLLYVIFGSSRHSSLGSITFVSLMTSSSLYHAGTSVGSLTLICAAIHFLIVAFRMEWVLGWVPDFLLNGAALGMFIRLVLSQIGTFFVFTDESCAKFDWCLWSAVDCLTTIHVWTLLLGVLSLGFLALFVYLINPIVINKVQFSIPHELLLILLSVFLSYACNFKENGIQLLLKTVAYRPPELSIPSIFDEFSASLLDGSALALFILASHLKVTKAIAMEKMQQIDRRQELVAFSIFELPMSFLGLPAVGTSLGLSQVNIESARFSLVSNIISCIWLMVFVVFCLPILQYLPKVTLACILVTSFPSVLGEVRHLSRLWKISRNDLVVFILGALSTVVVFNICRGFLLAIAFGLLSVVHRIQWPTREVLMRLDGDGRFGEEDRYEGEPCEAPARVLKFNAPLLFNNVDRLRDEVKEQCRLIKGQVPLGIGTRTGSLRSQIEVRLSAPLEAKQSIAQSRTNLTNFVINDPQAPAILDQTLVRCLIIDFSAINAVDTHGMHMLNQIYFELQEDNIKLLFATVSASVRDCMEIAGLFSLVPRNSFYPTINDAIMASRAMILPIHTSISLNGCRDMIALSNCTSNVELTKDNDSKGDPVPV